MIKSSGDKIELIATDITSKSICGASDRYDVEHMLEMLKL